MKTDLTVIVPVYNEEKTVLLLLQQLFDTLRASSVTYQVIVVDDGSTDETLPLLQKASRMFEEMTLLIHEKNKGKGAAIHTGVAQATGQYTILQDADLEYHPKDILRLFFHARSNKLKVVYGSRNVSGENTPGPFFFYWGGKLITYISNILFKQQMTDEATCYKLIDTSLLKNMPLEEKGFAFCPEVTAYIAKEHIRIPEIPISYTPRDKDAGKKINWRDGLEAIYTLFRLRFPTLPHMLRVGGVVLFTLFFYLLTWHMRFGGYEAETAFGAIGLLDGDLSVQRAGITAQLLYLPFIGIFQIMNFTNPVFLTIVPLFYTAVTAGILYSIVWHFTKRLRTALWVSLLIALGSSMWPYTNIGMEYQAGLYLSILLLTVLRWKQQKGSIVAVSIAFACLAAAKSYGPLFGFPLVGFLYSWHAQQSHRFGIFAKDVIRAILPAVLVVVGMYVLQYIQDGAVFGSYSVAHEFQVWTWWEGIYGIFFSAGKSIFFYCPLLVLTLFYWKPFFQKYQATSIFILGATLVLFCITAPFSYWSDETWGVRKLIPVIPLLHLPLILLFSEQRFHSLYKKSIVVLVMCVALYVQLLGAIYPYTTQLQMLHEGNVDSLHHMRFTPQFSHIVLYHTLFWEHLLDQQTHILYTDDTWFRWTRGEPDISLTAASIEVHSYSSPAVIWLSNDDSDYIKRYIGSIIVLIVMGSGYVLFRSTSLTREG